MFLKNTMAVVLCTLAVASSITADAQRGGAPPAPARASAPSPSAVSSAPRAATFRSDAPRQSSAVATARPAAAASRPAAERQTARQAEPARRGDAARSISANRKDNPGWKDAAKQYRTVVYERTGPRGVYIGRAEADRYDKRQAEHNRALSRKSPGQEYKFKELARYDPRTAKIAEQSMINRYTNRGIKLENRRNEMAPRKHMDAMGARQRDSANNFAKKADGSLNNRPSLKQSPMSARDSAMQRGMSEGKTPVSARDHAFSRGAAREHIAARPVERRGAK